MAIFLKTQTKKTGIFLKPKTPSVRVVQAQPRQTISDVALAEPRQTISGVVQAKPRQTIVPQNQNITFPPIKVSGAFPTYEKPKFGDIAVQSLLAGLVDVGDAYSTILKPLSSYFKTASTIGPNDKPLKQLAYAPGAVIGGFAQGIAEITKGIVKGLGKNDYIRTFFESPEKQTEIIGRPLKTDKDLGLLTVAVLGLDTGAGGVDDALSAFFKGGKRGVQELKKLAQMAKEAQDAFQFAKQARKLGVEVNEAQEIFRVVNKTKEEAARVAFLTPKTVTNLGEFSPLSQEATKYKSAEEFVNKIGNKIPVGYDWKYLDEMKQAKAEGYAYSHSDFAALSKLEKANRGTGISETFYRAGEIGKDGDVWLTPQKAGAEQYAKSGGTKIGEYKVATQKPLILNDIIDIEKIIGDTTDKNFINNPDLKQKVIDYAKKKGYDSVSFPDSFPDGKGGIQSLVVFDKSKIYTKSQLTDFYNQAVKTAKTVEVPKARAKPVPLAAKIDNAETALAKLDYEKESIGVGFHSKELDEQYNNFKKTVSLKELDSIEDAGQFINKFKDKLGTGKADGMLYSQDKTASEVFDLFKERRFKEFNARGVKGQINKEQVLIKRDLTKLEKEAKIRADKKQALDRLKEAYDKKIEGIKSAKDVLANRRTFIRSVQKQFGLSDSDLKTITRKDIRLMSNVEFKSFLDNIRVKAEQLADKRQLINELQDTIQRLELQKVENLQEALKLPSIAKMTPEQLESFNETLSQFKKGDEFLSVRKLETVDNTDLKGIRTLREAKEKLAKELNVDVSGLDNIKVDALDRFRYDTALAEKNPFYGLMVDTVNKSMLNAEARFLQSESKINTLINTARKSRKQGVVDKFVPQDKEIFKWLESPEEVKQTLNLTNEELEAAQYIQKQYADMRDYLVQFGTLKKYRQDYITHINRGFLEEWKETGLLSAMKNVFKQYQKEEAIFNIIDDTGKILPLEKFFQFSMRRTGGIAPTQNVADAFLSYLKAFEKKAALDSVVPKLDIYAHSLTPKVQTPRGLEFDRSLKTFVNEWLNTKKGRTAKIVGIEQGGRIDLLLRAGKAFTATLDLGLNIPVGIAARAGENITNFINLGTKKYALGLIRARTSQGKKIAGAYKNFIGRTPFSKLSDASKGLGEKLFDSAFGLFQDATVRANKTFLLGSLTDQEYKTGLLSVDRLAFLKSEMGRYRVVEGSKSVVGATSLGGVLTQYKSWAIPPIRTTIDNLSKLIKNPSLIKQREGQELIRATLSTLGVVFAYKALAGDEDDKSFTGTIINKIYRDAMTLVGALDPKTITSEPRLVAFMADLGESLSQIIKLEGIKKAEQTFTPRLIKQFIPKKEKATSDKRESGLPELPKLPKLPKIK